MTASAGSADRSVARALAAVFEREMRRAARRLQEHVQPIIFLFLVISVLAIGTGPDPQLLRPVLPAGIWVAVLLATAFSLDGMFRADYDDGTLDQLLLSPAPLTMLVGAKIAAHWFTGVLPLVLAGSAGAVTLGVDAVVCWTLLLGLLPGSLVLVTVGAVAAALTVGLRGAGMLSALIMLPLYVPTLIFGTVAARNAAMDLPRDAELLLLTGLAVLAATLVPFAAAAAVRIRAG